MRVLLINPGQDWPMICSFDSAAEIKRAVGGYVTMVRYGEYSIIYNSGSTSAPNRMIDGRVINGPIIIGKPGGLSIGEAQLLRKECSRWPRPRWGVAHV